MDKPQPKVIINLDNAIDEWNRRNPNKEPISRKYLYEKLGITKPTIQNYKNGKVPKALTDIFIVVDDLNLDLKDILNAFNAEGKQIF